MSAQDIPTTQTPTLPLSSSRASNVRLLTLLEADLSRHSSTVATWRESLESDRTPSGIALLEQLEKEYAKDASVNALVALQLYFGDRTLVLSDLMIKTIEELVLTTDAGDDLKFVDVKNWKGLEIEHDVPRGRTVSVQRTEVPGCRVIRHEEN